MPGVAQALAVEQNAPREPGGSRLVLLVVLQPGITFDRPLTLRIKKELSQQASQNHVPAVIAQVSGLRPRTAVSCRSAPCAISSTARSSSIAVPCAIRKCSMKSGSIRNCSRKTHQTRTDKMKKAPKQIEGRRIHVGVVGCGRIAANHFKAIEAHKDNLQLVAVCDTDHAALESAQKQYTSPASTACTRCSRVRRRPRRAGDAQRPAPAQAIEAAQAGPPRDDRKADGHALERRPGDGAGLRRRRRAGCSWSSRTAATARCSCSSARSSRAASAASTWSPSTSSGRARRATTTARPGAAPGSSTAARS